MVGMPLPHRGIQNICQTLSPKSRFCSISQVAQGLGGAPQGSGAAVQQSAAPLPLLIPPISLVSGVNPKTGFWKNYGNQATTQK